MNGKKKRKKKRTMYEIPELTKKLEKKLEFLCLKAKSNIKATLFLFKNEPFYKLKILRVCLLYVRRLKGQCNGDFAVISSIGHFHDGVNFATTTIIPFVFPFLFKFCYPHGA